MSITKWNFVIYTHTHTYGTLSSLSSFSLIKHNSYYYECALTMKDISIHTTQGHSNWISYQEKEQTPPEQGDLKNTRGKLFYPTLSYGKCELETFLWKEVGFMSRLFVYVSSQQTLFWAQAISLCLFSLEKKIHGRPYRSLSQTTRECSQTFQYSLCIFLFVDVKLQDQTTSDLRPIKVQIFLWLL